MKRFICVMFLALSVGLLCSSCSKEEDKDMMKVTNVSGIPFYDCWIFFKDTKDGEIVASDEVGDVLNDQSFKVRKQGNYFSIMAKNSTGRTVMSDYMWSSEQVKIFKSNLLAY